MRGADFLSPICYAARWRDETLPKHLRARVSIFNPNYRQLTSHPIAAPQTTGRGLQYLLALRRPAELSNLCIRQPRSPCRSPRASCTAPQDTAREGDPPFPPLPLGAPKRHPGLGGWRQGKMFDLLRKLDAEMRQLAAARGDGCGPGRLGECGRVWAAAAQVWESTRSCESLPYLISSNIVPSTLSQSHGMLASASINLHSLIEPSWQSWLSSPLP